MLFKTALRTVWHERAMLSGAVSGVALGVFLAVFQSGLYFGYKRDTTVVLDAFDADIWIVPKNQVTFDGFARMDDLPYWRAKTIAGVEDAARVVWGDTTWRLPASGGKDFLQILGIDPDSSIRARFQYQQKDDLRLVHADGHVLIGTQSRNKLGLETHPDRRFEIGGKEAFVAGFVDDVRLFSTAAFAMTDLHNAQMYLQMSPSQVTYIVCKCRPEARVADVVQRLQAAIPELDVLTTQQFRKICSDYWETSSGIGPVILMSAVLGAIVGLLIITLTFYISTIDKVPVYACFKAIGATMGEIVLILGTQVALVFLFGSAIAGAFLWAAQLAIRHADFSVLITPTLVLAALGIMLGCSAVGVLFSIRALFRVDPGEAFRT